MKIINRQGLPWLLICLGSWAPLSPPAAVAAESTTPTSGLQRFFEQDYLLGDWGGWRPRLAERGVEFEFLYAASLPRNVSGGIDTGTEYQGLFLMTLDLRSEPLVGYEGGTFHASSLMLHGAETFSEQHIGDFNKVNLIDFHNGFRLWELYYEQKLLENRLTLKAGQMVVDRDFILPEFYASLGFINLINQVFFYPTLAFNVWDIPGFPKGNHSLASTPYGAPGALARWEPSQPWYVQAAVYDGNPDQSNSGTRINLNSGEGALIYMEVGYRLNQGPGAGGLPGNLKLGAFYHTDDFPDNRSVLFGAPEYHSGTYGVYGLWDQVLFFEQGREDPAQQGLVGFFRGAGAPPDRNLTELEFSGGLVYRGLIPGRDWDSLALAASYIEISDHISKAQRDVNALIPGFFPVIADYEGVIELTYRAQVAAWWSVQTSVQRVIHPAGKTIGDIPDAWAVGLFSVIRF